MLNPKQIMTDLRKLGVKKDDIIVVHSSYNSLRGEDQIEGGPEAVIEVLKETVSEGTLIIPTFTYKNVDIDNRVFDVLNTPACIGILPETMRLSKDVVRSVHPTHSLAVWGKDADSFTKNHYKDHSPVGVNSPLSEAYRRGGKIVMLGAPFARNTSLHGVEEMVLPEYLFNYNYDYKMILENKETITMNVLRHDFNGFEQRYDRILDILEEGTDYQVGQVLNGRSCVMNAPAVWDKALIKYREDMLYFTDPRPRT
ncbi:AAC(3) family N-acetyltransferase [Vagococcus carniphilus]|uniref:Aminoglycoside N(3)-acetyltransferase n=1 Tax=Vagococcus carniphilus TaxID=218144 RepID=A0AAW8U8I2_9ENTE|nr:AAC(3) family N-acetyltransferase [Vagococcus carniphilus]MDT2831117.1 AAC(3) family N-acetyltransferase [Vagococcus carniphilus]MDT2833305.1 AAC(3) family N-acetyltransferase [Vagococcus carniphilus]MDT2839724.1 AAC(3) family N-acetyltransferase [Vagococcus carniphilus]MDT2854193.1 AAC(3) family N-acetyltransferase [Vagococcus carniphilus]